MSVRRSAPRARARDEPFVAPFAAATIETQLGRLRVQADSQAVRCVHFLRAGERDEASDGSAPAAAHTLVERTVAELESYFAGRLQEFTVPVEPRGTRFQQRVWRALQKIPFGATRSYGEIARAIGRPRAARAIGAANHANPVALIVPCHRVIGADRSLVGYGGGLDKKEWLLAHEAKLAGTAADDAPPASRKVAARAAAR